MRGLAQGNQIAAVHSLIFTNRCEYGENNVGADGGAKAAYLFSTNGNLLTTFTNPNTNGKHFGQRLAVLGEERVIFGAPLANDGHSAAYLFNLNGTLLTSIRNPHRHEIGADILEPMFAAANRWLWLEPHE